MASRLDKLYDLLESNNQSIRSAAAIQIGKLSANSQVELACLLKKLLPYVKHKTWSVRIAAADAVKHIGLNCKLWVPNVSSSCSGNKIIDFPEMISLEKLNLLEILKIGTRLYSTDMRELDETNADTSICKDEIGRHLGFMIPEECEIQYLLNNDDFQLHKSKQENKISIESAVKKSLAKASNKKCAKRLHGEATDGDEPDVKVQCVDGGGECSGDNSGGSEWPWAQFCDGLLAELWHAKWQIRHGAATALRELVRSQGPVMVTTRAVAATRQQLAVAHERYQEDVVGRLLCTLALDQLSDFVSDEMVAPVRESCAQVLGVMSVHLPDPLVAALARNLLSLLDYSEWTVNHGALLGLKYLIASRIDMADTLLPLVYGPISSHLKVSCDDDVRCAAAAALMPIFARPGCIALQSVQQLAALKLDLWQLLALRPDYTSPGATIAVLQLLEKLYEHHRDASNEQLEGAINRLHWCYYSYSDAVRLAAVRTCDAVLRSSGTADLSLATVSQVLCQLFQRVLVDDNGQVALHAETLWCWLIDAVPVDSLAQASLERLDMWMCCAMQPARLSYGPGAMLLPSSDCPDGLGGGGTGNDDCKLQFPKELFIGGRDSFLAEGDSPAREDAVLKARTAACRLLARLCRSLAHIAPLAEHILVTIIARIHLKERLAVQRFVAAMILAYWRPLPSWVAQETAMLAPLRLQLLAAIEEPIYYQELLPAFRQMAKACRDLLACYGDHGIATPAPARSAAALNLAQCQSVVTAELCASLSAAAVAASIDTGPIDALISCARTSVELCGLQHASLTRMVETALGRALLAWGWLPTLLTPLIRPLTDAVRCEARAVLQQEAAAALAQLVLDYGGVARLAAPASKLVRNIVQYLSDAIDASTPTASIGPHDVLALVRTAQLGRDAFPCQEDTSGGPQDSAIKLRGARLAIQKMLIAAADHHSDDHQIQPPPALLRLVLQTDGDELLPALRAMDSCLPTLSGSVALGAYAQAVFDHGLCQRDAVVRHWCARVLAGLIMPSAHGGAASTELSKELIDSLLLGRVLPQLDSLSGGDSALLGAAELLYLVMHRGPLQTRLALVVTVLPVVLRCLSAPLDAVRRTATHTFSLLLSLLPLEQSGADPSILSAERQTERAANRHFIEGLLRPESLPPYDCHSEAVSASLRHYQQAGVNWLSFLNRYGLHGVLADDMGLGKTLQTLCIIAGEHAARPDSVGPSLVVCPPTLTTHWQREIGRHVALSNFSSVIYAGSVDARLTLSQSLHRYQVVITSYDILRNDIDRLARPPTSGNGNSSGMWHYVVLDEGHLIRNHKSKVALAAKTVQAKHRLVLTGTPIHNRVGELWALFDFLMPGLLGSHADFQRRYGRLLDHGAATSAAGGKKGATSGGSDTEAAGTLALEALHRQVLPFMLRRVKEDVLHELPPKIIQDYMCTMTAIQARLYSYCVAASRHQSLDLNGIATDGSLTGGGSSEDDLGSDSDDRRQHIFQALHYLRLVCNHPKLALCESHPLYQSITKELAASGGGQSLDDIALSGKLVALKQLILDCGVGTDDVSGGGTGSTIPTAATAASTAADIICSASGNGVVSSHRLLVFCQSRSMVALVEQMFRSDIPKASYLRLDGSISIKERQSIVDKFNSDASIDILLLTTSIGGLGLNLTSADIVIFVEHDWNPMRDLQAMDRAHRIGQRNTVNVYRLITADSIEEKIMNLQKFKLFIANNVVSGDNKHVSSMNTDSLLDIMDKEGGRASGTGASGGDSNNNNNSNNSSGKSALKPVVLSRLEGGGVYDSLDEYSEEYNLESFVKKL